MELILVESISSKFMEENKYNLGKALLIAPTAPALLILTLIFLDDFNFNFIYGLIFVSTLLSSYLATFIIGLPIFLLLERLNRLSLLTLSGSGTLLGSILFTLPMTLVYDLEVKDLGVQIGWGAILGFAVSFIFGLLAGVRKK